MSRLPIVAITMGDPAGIGPEICLDLLESEGRHDCVPLVFGDDRLLRRVATELGRNLSVESVPFADHDAWRSAERPLIVDLNAVDANSVQPGVVTVESAQASYTYILAAIDAAMSLEVDAVTTAPIHKEAWQSAGIAYPGHTELFAERTAADRHCMLMTSPTISCALVTTHVGYADVPALLNTERILDVIELGAETLQRLRGRPPRLVVCGLNPHAGEDGLFGSREEERLILPAVEAARARGLDIVGPLPSDTCFVPRRRENTDLYICMYHDQGLIPLKCLAFDVAVNVTLGLPIVRTSVDHGTACDIAWQGKAESTSLAAAVRLAARLS